MATEPHLTWQPSLLETGISPGVDSSFASATRIELDPDAWVDYAPGWLSGSDGVFADVLETARWGQRTRRIYDDKKVEPRLTWGWRAKLGIPLEPAILQRAREVLSEHYGVMFSTVGFNLYRDGRDSVAWHRDRIPKEVEDPLVAILSLGEPRKFLLRPYGGGSSRRFLLGRGDLLVTGGRCQRTWEHSVPKVADAGPRISVTFRHGMYEEDEDDDAYA